MEKKNPAVWHWNQSTIIFNRANVHEKPVNISMINTIMIKALYIIIIENDFNTIF